MWRAWGATRVFSTLCGSIRILCRRIIRAILRFILIFVSVYVSANFFQIVSLFASFYYHEVREITFRHVFHPRNGIPFVTAIWTDDSITPKHRMLPYSTVRVRHAPNICRMKNTFLQNIVEWTVHDANSCVYDVVFCNFFFHSPHFQSPFLRLFFGTNSRVIWCELAGWRNGGICVWVIEEVGGRTSDWVTK